jgi:hypothetical protein
MATLSEQQITRAMLLRFMDNANKVHAAIKSARASLPLPLALVPADPKSVVHPPPFSSFFIFIKTLS